eukprot:m.422186 g.422186  ORF g.422186 m.422186 type:complete len:73 (-) comp16852_c0_seq5:1786-2004(-)
MRTPTDGNCAYQAIIAAINAACPDPELMDAVTLRTEVATFLENHPPLNESSLLTLESVHGHRVYIPIGHCTC